MPGLPGPRWSSASCAPFMRATCAPWRPPPPRRSPACRSILQPGFLEVAQHEAAYPTQRVRIGGVQRWISPQHAPALAAQDLFEVVHVPVDGLDVGIAALEQDLQVVIGTAEAVIQARG